jgi:hypothetical protein
MLRGTVEAPAAEGERPKLAKAEMDPLRAAKQSREESTPDRQANAVSDDRALSTAPSEAESAFEASLKALHAQDAQQTGGRADRAEGTWYSQGLLAPDSNRPADGPGLVHSLLSFEIPTKRRSPMKDATTPSDTPLCTPLSPNDTPLCNLSDPAYLGPTPVIPSVVAPIATLEKWPAEPPKSLSKLGGGKNKCMRCSKSVYAAESIAGPGGEWHKQCLACNACRKLLDTTTLMEHRGEVYCRACFGKSAFS